MYLPNPSADLTQGHLLAKYIWFEFRVFLILIWFALSRLKNPVRPTIYAYLEEQGNRWILAFPKSINTKWNTKTWSSIWTRVADSIRCVDKPYAKRASGVPNLVITLKSTKDFPSENGVVSSWCNG